MGIVGKFFGGVGTHTSYHVDTFGTLIERTWDWLKDGVLKKLAMVVAGTYLLTVVVDGGVRYMTAPAEDKKQDKFAVIRASASAASTDYVSVGVPAGKILGGLGWDLVTGICKVIYAVGSGVYEGITNKADASQEKQEKQEKPEKHEKSKDQSAINENTGARVSLSSANVSKGTYAAAFSVDRSFQRMATQKMDARNNGMKTKAFNARNAIPA